MKQIGSVRALSECLGKYRQADIGFVPTMGALHSGHLSLVSASKEQSVITVVSIFVNPTQFNNPDDLKKYPRDMKKDLNILDGVLSEEDIVFTPEYDDLYSHEQEYKLDLGALESVMEGEHRPGHFSGVVRVVKLLFEAVKPGKAYFGQKDLQQLTIIREMVRQLHLDIAIVACPIIREPHGLAMSSRNSLLTDKVRLDAAIIFNTLKKHSSISHYSDIQCLEEKVIDEIDSTEGFRTEYFDIVDSVTLTRVQDFSDLTPDRQYYGCIAVFAGDIRLIDNIEFSFLFIKG